MRDTRAATRLHHAAILSDLLEPDHRLDHLSQSAQDHQALVAGLTEWQSCRGRRSLFVTRRGLELAEIGDRAGGRALPGREATCAWRWTTPFSEVRQQDRERWQVQTTRVV